MGALTTRPVNEGRSLFFSDIREENMFADKLFAAEQILSVALEDRQRSTMFWQRATQFLDAAKVLHGHNKIEARLWPAIYLLIGQTIELSLKGFLRGHGTSCAYLKHKLGHNLEKAFATAERKGLGDHVHLSEDDRTLIEKLNAGYLSKDIQYPIRSHKHGGRKDWLTINIDDVLPFAERLVNGVKKHCIENMKKHDGKSTAVTYG